MAIGALFVFKVMNCPKCNANLKPWPWQDGDGYKGVQCLSCGTEWWSDSFDSKAHLAAKNAVDDLLRKESFPSDAETEEERRYRTQFRTPKDNL